MNDYELTPMISALVNKVFEQNAEQLSSAEQPEIVKSANISHDKIIKMLLMSDTLGRVQVIYPANGMLDVDTLNQKLGRSLEALPDEEVANVIAQYELTKLPAIPDITGLPAIIDEQVLELDEIYLESETPDQLIKLSKNAFSVLTKKAKVASFVVPISQIHCNISKPSTDLAQINQAIEKFTSLRIKQRLEDTLELPPLPQSAQDIIHLRANPDASADELADIIERDPSLAAQVVSWASSSFYNAPGKIKSVHDAIIRVLGFDMVMNLAMGLALGKTLKVPHDQPKGYVPYWQQAMWMALGTTAVISKIEPKHRPSFGLSYLSGLLHNFGYLVLAHIFPPHFKLMCRYIEANRHLDTAYIEHFLLGITREQIGGQLMSVWNMPEEVITALRHQKNPESADEHAQYACLLQLTHHLLASHGLLPGGPQEIDDSLYETLYISKEKAEEAVERLLDSQEDVAAIANLMGR
ncbi:MAG: HD-like signal output (HDOD) protein/prolyl-tRNA editing enzyme YbaK/EbsC (Cys-tRNA(Pro) deacylase) [Oleiphilaceae bacterium]|jgi:HD-like signal output (HDOD) protein/prolyl-tRNA editing enzyme YbaK/EbsC (Cys-tRNA(Pro) deacylase)